MGPLFVMTPRGHAPLALSSYRGAAFQVAASASWPALFEECRRRGVVLHGRALRGNERASTAWKRSSVRISPGPPKRFKDLRAPESKPDQKRTRLNAIHRCTSYP